MRDITDAHVVIGARRNGEAIVTSDPADLRRLDPKARLGVIRGAGRAGIGSG